MEATVDIPLNAVEPPVKKPYQFTRENARENALKGNAIRWSQEKQPKPSVEPPRDETREASDGFAAKTLLRVRGMIDSILTSMTKEKEPALIDKQASALARLAEIERQLSNRPLPGSLKPSQAKPRRSAEIEPEA